jgi:hypothetical protein
MEPSPQAPRDYLKIDWLPHFERLAPKMDRVRARPNAKRSYHLFADAIVWSDEYPDSPGRMSEFDCLKLLFRYRTTVLLGEPDLMLKPYWERALELFPNWAGFSPERLVAPAGFKEFLEQRGARAMRQLKLVMSACQNPESKHFR